MGKHEINAFLGAGTRFRGRLAFEGAVRLDGDFEGEIETHGLLVVGRGARVRGRLRLGELACDGLVEAEVTVGTRVVVHGSGRLCGTVRAPRLVVEEGGRVDGELVMEPVVTAAVSAPATLGAEEGPQGS